MARIICAPLLVLQQKRSPLRHLLGRAGAAAASVRYVSPATSCFRSARDHKRRLHGSIKAAWRGHRRHPNFQGCFRGTGDLPRRCGGVDVQHKPAGLCRAGPAAGHCQTRQQEESRLKGCPAASAVHHRPHECAQRQQRASPRPPAVEGYTQAKTRVWASRKTPRLWMNTPLLCTTFKRPAGRRRPPGSERAADSSKSRADRQSGAPEASPEVRE